MPAEIPTIAASFYGALLGASISAIGWFVVWATTKNREARKSLKAHLESMLKHLDDLFQTAVEYHTEERNELLELKTLWHLELVASDIRCCNKFFSHHTLKPIPNTNDYAIADSLIVSLRQSCTRKHFKDDHTAAMKPSAPFIGEIYTHIFGLRSRILNILVLCTS